MAVSVSLKTFCSTKRKCAEYVALGLKPLKRNWEWIMQRDTNKLIRNLDLWNLPLIHFLLLYFILFSEKNVFYSKNIQYTYNFYETDLNVCRGVFRTQSNIYVGASLQKSQKSFIVDARIGSKYGSGIALTVKKVYRSHYLSDTAKVDFKNLSLRC